MKKGPIAWPKTFVRNYHYLLHNNQEEHSACLAAVFLYEHKSDGKSRTTQI